MNKLLNSIKNNYFYIVYSLCTVGVCWTGVWRDIGNGAQWALAINCIGICVFPMIICRLDIREFFKIPYLIWSVLFLIFSYPAYMLIKPGTDFDMQFLFAFINIGLYGLIAIYLIDYCVIKKQFAAHNMTLVFWLWLFWFVWATASVNKSLYPLWFLIMFGSLYIIPISEKQKYEIMNGITTGIIISFFWVQGRAFLYRPYDLSIRYNGHFTNSSVNCMFYLVVYSAWLYKMAIAKQQKSRFSYIVFLYIFSFSMLDFVFLTGSRGGVLSVFLITAVYLIIEQLLILKKGLKGLIVSGLIVVMIFLLMFVPVYLCARYIPALRHHPIWYKDYSEKKVHSWDPIDSEKYISLEQALSNFVAMKNRTIDNYKKNEINDSGSDDYQEYCIESENDNSTEVKNNETEANKYDNALNVDPSLFVSVISTEKIVEPTKKEDYPGFVYVLEYSDGVEPGTDQGYHPAGYFTEDNNGLYVGTLGIRKFIYRYFVERLNLIGHAEVYPYVYFGHLLGYYGHTHNAFLQVAYCFGIPAGLAFALLCLSVLVIPFVRKTDKITDNITYVFSVIYIIAFVSYGLTDCLSLLGNIMYSLFFLSIIPLMRKSDDIVLTDSH